MGQFCMTEQTIVQPQTLEVAVVGPSSIYLFIFPFIPLFFDNLR